jgi:hypothetical protein
MVKVLTSSNGGKPNDTVLTPKWVFEELKLEFDLDVASPSYKTNVPCKTYFTEEDDALSKEWFGLVWMNPPYSKPTPWVDRFIEHNNGIALLPLVRSKWFNNIWESNALMYLMPTLTKFDRPNGKSSTIWGHTALFGLGAEAKSSLSAMSFGKVR